ncbi:hypothetical protein EG329_000632 [Mollisiaceae sp. DMI_Dod_QoI]|nr:hypothetical protein EG329_000632 [Helotiales sp. DMI_Dod_QoI]
MQIWSLWCSKFASSVEFLDMAAQANGPPGVTQYFPYPHPPGPPPVLQHGMHLAPRALVTWTWASTPKTSEPCKTLALAQRNAEFHFFPRLPLELRLKIWNYTLRPRVIEIRSWADSSSHEFAPIAYSIPPQKPPIIFRINHESREEARRLYALIEIGVSVSTIDPDRQYLAWRNHPMNPRHERRHFIGFYAPGSLQPLAKPFATQKTYINFSYDTIYLGPEFHPRHIEAFFTATGPRMELSALQYLAIDRKLWVATSLDFQDNLRTALYSLRSRPVKEIYIIPDDVKGCLEDKFYYREHEISLQEAPYIYTFHLPGQENEKTVIRNLEEWFKRLWKDCERTVPKLEIKSIRRDGRCLASFKDGTWEVQKTMGSMDNWKTWTPPTVQSRP